MEDNARITARVSGMEDPLPREIIAFFQANPFALVSEARLASMLCRPRDMVSEAVRALEECGLLVRSYSEALLGVEESTAQVGP